MTQFAEILESRGEASIVLMHSHYDVVKLTQVKTEMQELGAPTVRAIWDEAYGMFWAIEGCHRLRAAQALGIIPNIVDVSEQETVVVQLDGEDAEIGIVELLEDIQDQYRPTILTFEA